MYKIRNFVTRPILISIYYSLIYPFLIYAIPVWGVANEIYMKPLHILQKKVVRLITFNDEILRPAAPLIHSAPIFNELQIITIYDIFKAQTTKFVYECINYISPPQFFGYYEHVPAHHNTMASRNNNLKIPFARTTTYGLNSIKNIGARIWNKIPVDIHNAASVKSFSKNLKKYLITNYI